MGANKDSSGTAPTLSSSLDLSAVCRLETPTAPMRWATGLGEGSSHQLSPNDYSISAPSFPGAPTPAPGIVH